MMNLVFVLLVLKLYLLQLRIEPLDLSLEAGLVRWLIMFGELWLLVVLNKRSDEGRIAILLSKQVHG